MLKEIDCFVFNLYQSKTRKTRLVHARKCCIQELEYF